MSIHACIIKYFTASSNATVILIKRPALRMNPHTFMTEEKLFAQSAFPNRDSSPT